MIAIKINSLDRNAAINAKTTGRLHSCALPSPTASTVAAATHWFAFPRVFHSVPAFPLALAFGGAPSGCGLAWPFVYFSFSDCRMSCNTGSIGLSRSSHGRCDRISLHGGFCLRCDSMGSTFLSRNVVDLCADTYRFFLLICHAFFVNYYGHVAKISRLFPNFYGINDHSYSKPVAWPGAAVPHFFHAFAKIRFYLPRVGLLALISSQLCEMCQITSAAHYV